MTKTIAALGLLALPVFAQVPLKSAAWQGPEVPCGTYAYSPDLMPLSPSWEWETQNAKPGAGVWPVGYNLTVRKVCLTHAGSFTGPSYAVVGHSGPNGDHVSPYLVNQSGSVCMSYEKDAAVVVTGGEYFDIHAGCSVGSHHVILQLWYTQP